MDGQRTEDLVAFQQAEVTKEEGDIQASFVAMVTVVKGQRSDSCERSGFVRLWAYFLDSFLPCLPNFYSHPLIFSIYTKI